MEPGGWLLVSISLILYGRALCTIEEKKELSIEWWIYKSHLIDNRSEVEAQRIVVQKKKEVFLDAKHAIHRKWVATVCPNRERAVVEEDISCLFFNKIYHFIHRQRNSDGGSAEKRLDLWVVKGMVFSQFQTLSKWEMRNKARSYKVKARSRLDTRQNESRDDALMQKLPGNRRLSFPVDFLFWPTKFRFSSPLDWHVTLQRQMLVRQLLFRQRL